MEACEHKRIVIPTEAKRSGGPAVLPATHTLSSIYGPRKTEREAQTK
jgi:hypothetical protein